MEGIDPDTLLEWLQTGFGDERDLQLMAIEQLCMLLLMSDNIDRCFESCPPRTFLPALCKIFLDETATENVLEVTARAITYYLDVSNECTRRITQVDGAVKAICSRLAASDLTERSSKDLAEQCVKLLEHVCQRETLAVYEAGGLNAMLSLVINNGSAVHKDTLHSAMSVITRLCGKMEPTDSALPKCAENLGALLAHDDPKVSECALRCFAAMTDRMIRKQLDPIEIATHSDLVGQLLSRLNSDSASSNFLSVVLSLLSNLCRGSAAVTEQVLSSRHLIDGLGAVLRSKEERVVSDGLRLADLLLVLLCDGRGSLPQAAVSLVDGAANTPASADRTHRHLIDVIRQKDTAALIDAVDSGAVDVNYTDDVGQTLLNWAAAFGSPEMVVYLCQKGADVNKGLKSSSLHYAASFGRPDVTKLLLERGANPDLRDEDGKTALDKARERTDDDYAAVAAILESPSMYMAPSTRAPPIHGESSTEVKDSSNSNIDTPDRKIVLRVLYNLVPIFCDIYQKATTPAARRSSLSLLRKAVQHMNLEDVEGESSGEEEGRENEAVRTRVADSISELIVRVLDLEDDYDSQEQALLVMEALLEKERERWLVELIRLGLFEKVEALANQLLQPTPLPPPTTSSSAPLVVRASSVVADERGSERSVSSTPSVAFSDAEGGVSSSLGDERERERAAMLNVPVHLEDDSATAAAAAETPPPTVEVASVEHHASASPDLAAELAIGTAYRWREWRIIRGNQSLFLWADPMALEFPFDSSGCSFRILVDGRLKCVLVGKRVDDCTAAEKDAFVARFRLAKTSLPSGTEAKFISAATSGQKKATFPSWELSSPKPTELVFRCPKAVGVTIKVSDEMAAVHVEHSENSRFTLAADSLLDVEFHTGWASFSCPRSSRLRHSMQRRRVQELALTLWNKHLKEAKARPREALLQLQAAAAVISDAIRSITPDVSSGSAQPRIERVQELVSALDCVREAAVDERRLSPFDIAASGLIPALTQLFDLVLRFPKAYPTLIFKEAFSTGSSLTALTSRMLRVLETTEKFPVYAYDTLGGSAAGLQMLSKRVRLRLQLGDTPLATPTSATSDSISPADNTLINRTGRLLKSEPLTTVAALKVFLLRFVVRQWFDRIRSSFAFVHQINEAKKTGKPLRFEYSSDFDEQGIIYWLGTNGKTVSEWTNPASVGVVVVNSSDSPHQPFGRPEDILSRDTNPLNCHTSDDRNAWFMMDLGVMVRPSHYTLRHARGYSRSALRSWLLQGSRDATSWVALSCHRNDSALVDAGSTASWPIELPSKRGCAYRYFRIAQNGENSSGQTHYLSLSGFEVYGEVVDVVETDLRPAESASAAAFGAVERKKKGSGVVSAVQGRSASSFLNECRLRKSRQSSTADSTPSSSTRVSVEDEGAASRTDKNTNNKVLLLEEIRKGSKAQPPAKSRVAARRMRPATADMTGARVVRGPDWRWAAQDGGEGGQGIVVGSLQGGWLDVQWDSGAVNSYRYGNDGRYDVIRSDEKERRKGAATGGTAARGVASPNEPTFSFSGLAQLGLRARRPGAPTSQTPKSRLTAAPTSASPSAASTAASSAASPPSSQASSVIVGKKSMSTTNLVDERASSGPLVSATGQAASAESLQHQTPSLENLLANYSFRSRMEPPFDEVRETPEPSDSLSSPAPPSESAEAAAAPSASSPSGIRSGSWQPQSRREGSDESAEVVGEEDEDCDTDPHSSSTQGGDKNLSVSAPDLAARRSVGDAYEMLQKALAEDDEEQDEDDESRDDKSAESYSDLFMESLVGPGNRSLIEKLKDVIGIDGDYPTDSAEGEGGSGLPSSSSSTLAAAPSSFHSQQTPPTPSSSSSRAVSASKKTVGAIKTKVSTYADVLKSMMQQMMEPSATSIPIDGDELEDEEMLYDEDVDANEDDLDDLHLPSADSLAAILAKGSSELRNLNWKQLTQLMLGIRAERGNGGGRGGGGGGASTRDWDDELILKCSFNALIPAFDPRPGRTNAKQTQEMELPTVVPDIVPLMRKSPTPGCEPTLRLFLTGPNLPNIQNVTVEMEKDDCCIFKYLQKIVNAVDWPNPSEKSRRFWDATYTLSYEDAASPSRVRTSQLPTVDVIPDNVSQVLRLLSLLSSIGACIPDCQLAMINFISDKLTSKLTRQLADPLVVASNALPEWCERLVFEYPTLFAVETRQLYLEATSFGISRSIVWLQSRRDAVLEKSRGAAAVAAAVSGSRRDDHYEYRLGRIKHERVKVTRCEDQLLEQAIRLMRFHAERKAILEIEYTGEEGTGLGPTLEFYALVAAEFQRKVLAIWMCDDLDETQLKMEETELDLGEGKKPPGYYVRRAGGLFPAPLPPHSDSSKRASELFRVLGIFLAKVLQDGRLVDLPLSLPFLKLVVHPQVTQTPQSSLENILTLDDFEEVHPVKGRFLKELSALAARKRSIEADVCLSREAKRRRLEQLKLCINGSRCRVEDLALNFCVNPPSSVFDYDEMELVEGGADLDVTMDNVELYVEKCTDYYLNSGIHQQVSAFREGFDRVFQLSSLRAFSPDEVQRLLSGEQCPEWTREDVINFTEPKLGYTRESPAFLRFVQVLVGMSASERKSFLQFATGSSSLPPGGLANLHPRLTIVRKVESGDGSYPSVNTCVHYLKLPEYSSAEIMRERLLTATKEKGFHLN